MLRSLAMVVFFVLAPISTSHGQTALAPAGWSDLDVWAHGAGLWINAQRICGIVYDPAKLERQMSQSAQFSQVSLSAFKRAAQAAADRQVAHVTRETCSHAKAQAARLDLLPGKPRRPSGPIVPPPQSLSN